MTNRLLDAHEVAERLNVPVTVGARVDAVGCDIALPENRRAIWPSSVFVFAIRKGGNP
jgi:hypothetical protein